MWAPPKDLRRRSFCGEKHQNTSSERFLEEEATSSEDPPPMEEFSLSVIGNKNTALFLCLILIVENTVYLGPRPYMEGGGGGGRGGDKRD